MIAKIKKNIRESHLFGKLYILLANAKVYINTRPFMDDEKYLKRLYMTRFSTNLDLVTPRSFNEKNNWRKLYDRNPIYTDMVDKRKAKEFIESRVGKGYSFGLIATWTDPNDINISTLPDTFVLKCNHSGGVYICRDKKIFDIEKVKKKLADGLKVNYYLPSREWPYKDVERCIICEEYMGENLVDYKVYCFNGIPRYIFVWSNHPKSDGTKPVALFCGAYTVEWEKDKDIDLDYPSENTVLSRPDCLDELLRIAKEISKGTTFLRVDCYIINNRPYVGEMTFFPWAGFMKFKNDNADAKLGNMEQLHL